MKGLPTAAVSRLLHDAPYNPTVPYRARGITTALMALALTACAGSVAPKDVAPPQTQALAYVLCLRSHGVAHFPDPAPDGRLPNIPNDIDTAAPAFRSAQQACANLEPGAHGSSVRPQTWMPRLLALAECIRRHGLHSFPDPTTSPPPPPPGNDHGNAMGGPGAYLAFPPPSPALSRAKAACGFRIP